MKTSIYCKPAEQGTHIFYILAHGKEYYLFTQKFRKGVQEYYGKGVTLSKAINYSKTHRDSAIIKTMTKLPAYIRYIEREYEIDIMEKTKRQNERNYSVNNLKYA